MIPLINKMKRKDGFTLVELIVVLVILAILAAFTIPAMLGYINDAREKAGLSEARTALIAVQATTDSLMGSKDAAARKIAFANGEDSIAKAFGGEITNIKYSISNNLLIAKNGIAIQADSTFEGYGALAGDASTIFSKYISGDLTSDTRVTSVDKSPRIGSVTTSDDGQILTLTYARPDYIYVYSDDQWTITETPIK